MNASLSKRKVVRVTVATTFDLTDSDCKAITDVPPVLKLLSTIQPSETKETVYWGGFAVASLAITQSFISLHIS